MSLKGGVKTWCWCHKSCLVMEERERAGKVSMVAEEVCEEDKEDEGVASCSNGLNDCTLHNYLRRKLKDVGEKAGRLCEHLLGRMLDQ